MRDKIKDLLICNGMDVGRVNSAAEEICKWASDMVRQDRMVKSFFVCSQSKCNGRVEVVLDIGADNYCQINATCPHCKTKHSVKFVRTIEPKLVRPEIGPVYINGRLFE